jgi:hypothetical protein
MNYTQYPSQPEQHSAPHFDKFQFDNGRGRFLKGAKLDFRDVERMHLLRVANQQAGRRTGVPSWSLSDQTLRHVVLHYLSTRFAVKNTHLSLQQRLALCTAAGKRRARKEKKKTEQRIQEYRAISGQRFHELEPAAYVKRLFSSALRGESFAEHLRLLELQILNSDSSAFVSAHAAEIALAVAYYAYRLGWPSPSIAEELNLRAPAVRQILSRLNRAARRLEMGPQMWTPRGRPVRKASGH